MTRTAAPPIWVPHCQRHLIATGWCVARCMAVLVAATFVLGRTRAQAAPCGLTSMQETIPAFYPPIARVAHIEGSLIFLIKFAKDGAIENVHYLTGPPLLEGATRNYVGGLRANSYSGPRECPVILRFVLDGTPEQWRGVSEILDPQHITIHASTAIINTNVDPSPTHLRRRKSLLIF
jgi:hypothetical protein